MGVEFTGAKQLQDVARRLQRLSNDMRHEVETAMANELGMLQSKIRKSAMSTLPTRGGLSRKIAQSSMTVAKRNGAVVLRVTNRSNISNMNKGFLRHPVFGNRQVWVSQRVPRGWFDHPVSQSEVRLRHAVNQAQQQVINKVR